MPGKKPHRSLPHGGVLAADLDNYLAGRPVSVRPAGPMERTLKWVRRNPAIAGATAAVALALVAGSAVSLAFGLQARKKGEELANANADLSAANDNLTNSRDDLRRSRNEVAASLKDVQQAAADTEESGYLSDVALAHQLWKANDLAAMRSTLDAAPRPGGGGSGTISGDWRIRSGRHTASTRCLWLWPTVRTENRSRSLPCRGDSARSTSPRAAPAWTYNSRRPRAQPGTRLPCRQQGTRGRIRRSGLPH